MSPKLPAGAERRRPEPVARHSPSVHVMGDRLVAMCRCGAVLGGNREEDPRVMSLDDMLRLSVRHNSDINNPRRFG